MGVRVCKSRHNCYDGSAHGTGSASVRPAACGSASGAERPWGWQVKAFEAAIRKALQKVDSTDPKLRARIYQSARDALVGSQEKQGVTGTDTAARQASLLEELITSIDREFTGTGSADMAADLGPPERASTRQEPPPLSGAQAHPGPPQPRNDAPDQVPLTAGADLRAERVAPPGKTKRTRRKKEPEGDPLDAVADKRGKDAKGARRGRPVFSLMLVAALAIAFVGIAVLWVVFNGLLLTSDERDTSVPNPPATVDGGDFIGGEVADGSVSDNWTTLFMPDDLSGVAQRSNANAAVVDVGGNQALQIVSSDPGTDGEVLFELDPGVLQALVGNKSLVAVTLRTSSDTPSQMYVRCMLPGDESCGRHRFDVSYEVGDVVFSLDLTGKTLAGGPGFLAINSDINGTGHGVDVLAIRARPQ